MRSCRDKFPGYSDSHRAFVAVAFTCMALWPLAAAIITAQFWAARRKIGRRVGKSVVLVFEATFLLYLALTAYNLYNQDQRWDASYMRIVYGYGALGILLMVFCMPTMIVLFFVNLPR